MCAVVTVRATDRGMKKFRATDFAAGGARNEGSGSAYQFGVRSGAIFGYDEGLRRRVIVTGSDDSAGDTEKTRKNDGPPARPGTGTVTISL
jgi:hypothetical protein